MTTAGDAVGSHGEAATPAVRAGDASAMGRLAQRGTPASDAGPSLPVLRGELVALIAITVAASVLRFAYVGTGGPWDSDQGTAMIGIWTAVTTGQLPTFGPQATSLSDLTFHHGALFYDLLIPAAWLTHGDPRAILAEIAALNSLVVPMLWWVARGIGGRATGLIVAVMAATSADLVFFSTFIWNPNFVEPGAALALLGAWQAWRSRQPVWWLAAAAGFTLATQSHETAAVLVLPLGATFLLDLRRGCSAERHRTLLWGVAGFALLVLTYVPVILHELTSGFTETRAIASYLSAPEGYVSAGPVARLVFAAIRIPNWPLTGWPYFELRPGVLLALVVVLAASVACTFLMLRTWRHRQSISGGEIDLANERAGVALVVGGLVSIILALGLGLRAVSELNLTMSEQYHTAADPFVLVAAGVAIGAIWQSQRIGPLRLVGRTATVAIVVAFVGWNAIHWPPITSTGSWQEAQAAAVRIEGDAAGGKISLVPLDVAKGADAYAYPLLRDGNTVVAPDDASTIVVLCDSAWITEGCGGAQEEQWRNAYSGGKALTLVDRFEGAPEQTLSVYRRIP